MAKQPTLSIVVPCFNEGENIQAFYKQLKKALQNESALVYEIIYVDDGSDDDTLSQLKKLAQKDSSIKKVITFSRNFGKERATTAGIIAASGEAIILIDGDGQHPPEIIHQFLQKWRNGAQVVVGVRESNEKEGPIKHIGSRLFYRLIRSAAGVDIIPRSTDFRLIDKTVQQEFINFTERGRITRGLIDWMGFTRETIEFAAKARMGGKATYSISKLIKLATDSFVSLSLAPLYFSGYAGLIITPLSLLGGLFILIEQILLGDPLGLNVTGTAMLALLTVFLVGLLLISQGLIALYISHIHTETQNRPLYIIDRSRSVGL